VIGKKPPSDWEKPLIPVLLYKYVISLSDGSCMPVLSLEAEGSGNGFNLQANVGDEAKFFNEKKLKGEIIRAIRGCNKQFGHLAEFQSQWYFSDKYEGNVQWMIDKRKLMNQKLIDAVIVMQIELNNLIAANAVDPNDERTKKIIRYTQLLNKTQKHLVYVSEASALHNRRILGDEYFANQKLDSTESEYNVAILNKDPDKIENCFYPEYKEAHNYQIQNDVNLSRPLIIALDYQWKISPIVQAQYAILPGRKDLTLNYNYSCHVLHPHGLDEAINKWAQHNRNHINKIVYYLYDKTAVGKSPNREPYYKTVIKNLRAHGWRVVPLNMGDTPLHNDKFKEINNHLKVPGRKPAICINSFNNQDMITSINLSPAKTVAGKTVKDKSSEGNLSVPAVRSTHFSDTFDMIFNGCIARDMVPKGSSAAIDIAMM